MRCYERLPQVGAVVSVLASPALVHAHDASLNTPLPALPQYLPLGVEHVLLGFDHLAFVLGLMLLTHGRRTLLWALTAFTLSHSASLAASVLGVVRVPGPWVEAAIALSIVYVAFAREAAAARARPVWLSFGVGFVHGLGFAGALEEVGIPLDATTVALALFNLGVEIGQLVFVACVAWLIAWLRRRSHGLMVLRLALLLLGVGLSIERVESVLVMQRAWPFG